MNSVLVGQQFLTKLINKRERREVRLPFHSKNECKQKDCRRIGVCPFGRESEASGQTSCNTVGTYRLDSEHFCIAR